MFFAIRLCYVIWRLLFCCCTQPPPVRRKIKHSPMCSNLPFLNGNKSRLVPVRVLIKSNSNEKSPKMRNLLRRFRISHVEPPNPAFQKTTFLQTHLKQTLKKKPKSEKYGGGGGGGGGGVGRANGRTPSTHHNSLIVQQIGE